MTVDKSGLADEKIRKNSPILIILGNHDRGERDG